MSVLNLSTEPNQEKIFADNYELLARVKSGASWFYWIAALSLINSMIFLFGGNWSFFAGLGITQLLDAVVNQLSRPGEFSAVKIITFFIDLIIAGIFLMCGLWANKFQLWAFIVGASLYILDAILLLILGAYLPAAFHVFVVFMIYRGFSASRQLAATRNPPLV